jgi:hypothetical protein
VLTLVVQTLLDFFQRQIGLLLHPEPFVMVLDWRAALAFVG